MSRSSAWRRGKEFAQRSSNGQSNKGSQAGAKPGPIRKRNYSARAVPFIRKVFCICGMHWKRIMHFSHTATRITAHSLPFLHCFQPPPPLSFLLPSCLQLSFIPSLILLLTLLVSCSFICQLTNPLPIVSTKKPTIKQAYSWTETPNP